MQPGPLRHYSTALNIYNLPSALMVDITASVIPAISARAQHDRGGEQDHGLLLRIAALLALPMGVGLFVLRAHYPPAA